MGLPTSVTELATATPDINPVANISFRPSFTLVQRRLETTRIHKRILPTLPTTGTITSIISRITPPFSIQGIVLSRGTVCQ